MLILISVDSQLDCPRNLLHIPIKVKQSDQLYDKIPKLGLALEEHMLNASVKNAALVWNTRYFVDANEFCDLMDFRTDEILFPSLDINTPLSWAAGHANALVKWAATCRDMQEIDFIPWPQYGRPTAETADLVWWAQRINLKVYGLDA